MSNHPQTIFVPDAKGIFTPVAALYHASKWQQFRHGVAPFYVVSDSTKSPREAALEAVFSISKSQTKEKIRRNIDEQWPGDEAAGTPLTFYDVVDHGLEVIPKIEVWGNLDDLPPGKRSRVVFSSRYALRTYMGIATASAMAESVASVLYEGLGLQSDRALARDVTFSMLYEGGITPQDIATLSVKQTNAPNISH